jgi:hypothetical protein
MSETVPATGKPSQPRFIIVKIIAGHAHTFNAPTAACTESLESIDHSILSTSYENTINLTRAVHSSENLTNWFTALLTETEYLTLEPDASLANYNALTTTAHVTRVPAHANPCLCYYCCKLVTCRLQGTD